MSTLVILPRYSWIKPHTSAMMDIYFDKFTAYQNLISRSNALIDNAKTSYLAPSGLSLVAIDQELKAIAIDRPGIELQLRFALRDVLVNYRKDAHTETQRLQKEYDNAMSLLEIAFCRLGFSRALFSFVMTKERPQITEVTRLNAIGNIVSNMRTKHIDNERHIKALCESLNIPYDQKKRPEDIDKSSAIREVEVISGRMNDIEDIEENEDNE